MRNYDIFVAKMRNYDIFVAKTRSYDISVAKIYDYALIDSFWGFPRFIDSPTSYATLGTGTLFGIEGFWDWLYHLCLLIPFLQFAQRQCPDSELRIEKSWFVVNIRN